MQISLENRDIPMHQGDLHFFGYDEKHFKTAALRAVKAEKRTRRASFEKIV